MNSPVKTSKKLRLAALALVAAGLLAGCGGNGQDFVAESNVPTNTTTSISELILFMLALQQRTSDMSEPILLGNAVLASDETSEPTALP